MNDMERLFALSAGERFHAIDGANVVQIEYCMGVVRANECDCEECLRLLNYLYESHRQRRWELAVAR